MPLFLDTGRSPAELNAANCVTVGLINNMPDAAFEATERQFAELIREVAPSRVVLLKLFRKCRAARICAGRWPENIAILPSCGTRRSMA
jgi:hypothetical protein